jgi:hypothetical protein
MQEQVVEVCPSERDGDCPGYGNSVIDAVTQQRPDAGLGGGGVPHPLDAPVVVNVLYISCVMIVGIVLSSLFLFLLWFSHLLVHWLSIVIPTRTLLLLLFLLFFLLFRNIAGCG